MIKFYISPDVSLKQHPGQPKQRGWVRLPVTSPFAHAFSPELNGDFICYPALSLEQAKDFVWRVEGGDEITDFNRTLKEVCHAGDIMMSSWKIVRLTLRDASHRVSGFDITTRSSSATDLTI